MVHKKSEYQNEFKSSIAKKHLETYLENLTFRHHRRDREFLHTPIGWWEQKDDEEEQSSDNDENNEAYHNVKSKTTGPAEPQYQSLAEILTESNKKHEAFRQKKGKSTGEVDIDVGLISLDSDVHKDTVSGVEMPTSCSKEEDLEIGKQCDGGKTEAHDFPKSKFIHDKDSHIEDENNLRDRESSKSKGIASDVKKYKCSKKSTLNTQTRDMGLKLTKSSGKPKRPDRQGEIPGTSVRPQSAILSSQERPPFLSYGAGDREATLAKHRTHNVRSSVDVYAQALKAQKMREAEKRRRQREKTRAIKSANALLEKLTTVTPRDSQSWQSEYRKQFHGYEPQEYERAVSSRAVITRSTPINAVHRGGCLIVHVD